jgi:hypothetical protein
MLQVYGPTSGGSGTVYKVNCELAACIRLINAITYAVLVVTLVHAL